MDQILINLKDPSWWFNGIFFVVIGILLTKLGTTWLPYLWKLLAQIIPKVTSKFQRWKKRRILIRVKRYRQHAVKVNWLNSRYWTLVTVFILYGGFLAISYSLTRELGEKPNEVRKLIPVVAPIYFFQLFVMWEQAVLKAVIKAHIKWQKTHNPSFKRDA